MITANSLPLFDLEPKIKKLYDDIICQLKKQEKSLPNVLLYDKKGSQLFDQITKTKDYYLTRTEMRIMRNNIEEISKAVGQNAVLIEYGSGSNQKIKLLLNHLYRLRAYIPIDISKKYLMNAVNDLQALYPVLHILPICANFHNLQELPFDEVLLYAQKKVAFYPGSTIGQQHPEEAEKLLRKMRKICKPNGGLLIGVDLKKDKAIIDRAYDDSEGVSQQFGLNMLTHINNRFHGNFDLNNFSYQIGYVEQRSRNEACLVSQKKHSVQIGKEKINFEAGEKINFAYSYKYTLEEFEALALRAGWSVQNIWTDDKKWYSVQYLEANY